MPVLGELQGKIDAILQWCFPDTACAAEFRDALLYELNPQVVCRDSVGDDADIVQRNPLFAVNRFLRCGVDGTHVVRERDSVFFLCRIHRNFCQSFCTVSPADFTLSVTADAGDQEKTVLELECMDVCQSGFESCSRFIKFAVPENPQDTGFAVNQIKCAFFDYWNAVSGNREVRRCSVCKTGR